jgi:hypothetical protein
LITLGLGPLIWPTQHRRLKKAALAQRAVAGKIGEFPLLAHRDMALLQRNGSVCQQRTLISSEAVNCGALQ